MRDRNTGPDDSAAARTSGRALREPLLDARFRADGAKGRTPLPADRVRGAIETVPTRFTLYDRDGQPAAELGVGQTHFALDSSGLAVLDHRTGRHREATTADLVEYVRVGHRLRHIRLLATAFSPGDIEPLVSDTWRLYLALRGSSTVLISGVWFAVRR